MGYIWVTYGYLPTYGYSVPNDCIRMYVYMYIYMYIYIYNDCIGTGHRAGWGLYACQLRRRIRNVAQCPAQVSGRCGVPQGWRCRRSRVYTVLLW